MRRPARLYRLLFVLLPLLLLGCDSNDDRRVGNFQAEVRNDLTMQLEGSAQFVVETDDDGTPSHFEIMLFGETGPSSEILIQSAPGSGAPEEATYSVEQTITGGSPLDMRVEFISDRFNNSAPRYIGETGIVEITGVTDASIEGQFNFDAADSNTGGRVTIDGQFLAQRQ